MLRSTQCIQAELEREREATSEPGRKVQWGNEVVVGLDLQRMLLLHWYDSLHSHSLEMTILKEK